MGEAPEPAEAGDKGSEPGFVVLSLGLRTGAATLPSLRPASVQ